MKGTKSRKVLILVMGILLVLAVSLCWLFRWQLFLSPYQYRCCLKRLESPDGQHGVELILLGREDERGQYPPIQNPRNDRYDVCVRLWFKPEQEPDGSVWWYDTNTKYLYFKRDCMDLEMEWLDDGTVVIDGKERKVS